jgi:hypothetical protein
MTRPERSNADWADDSSLYFRLKHSVHALARGKRGWGDCAEIAFAQLEPVRVDDLPAEHQAAFRRIRELEAACTMQFPTMAYRRPHNLTPTQRDALVSSILELYEAMTRERVRQNID